MSETVEILEGVKANYKGADIYILPDYITIHTNDLNTLIFSSEQLEQFLRLMKVMDKLKTHAAT